MIPSQTFESFPIFGDNATKVKPNDAKYAAGFQQADVLPAEWVNWEWSKASQGIKELQDGLKSIESEIIAVLTAASITPSEATPKQLKAAIDKIIESKTGVLSTLSTTEKNTLVAAINEIVAGLGSASSKDAGSAAGNVPLVGTALGTTNNNIVVTDTSGSVKPFGKTPNQIAYWGNGGGVCHSLQSSAAKTISIDGFTLYTGVTVKVMFTNGNSSTTPTLNVNSTGAKNIKVVKAGAKITPPVHTGKWRGASSATTEAWQPLTTLELMYDGTDWVIIGNPVVEDYSSTDQSYTVYANGLIEQQYKKTTLSSGNADISFNVQFTTQYNVSGCIEYNSNPDSIGIKTSNYDNTHAVIGVRGAGSGVVVFVIFKGY